MPLARDRFPCRYGFPGHEGVGEVVESGSQSFGSGQRVLMVPDRATCEGFADFQVVEEKFLLPIPDGILPQIAVLAQPLGTVVYAVKKCLPRETPETAVVLGQGMIGLCFTWLLKRVGVVRVVAADLEPSRRALARRFGADLVIDGGRESVAEAVLDFTNGNGAPLIIEAAGTDVTRLQAIDLVSSDGYICFFGLPEKDEMERFNFAKLFRTRATARSMFNAQHEAGLASFREALSLIEAGEIDLGSVVSHSFRLGEIRRAFEMAYRREDGVVKVCITFD